jgi:succinate dehydrogenase / fumarate reductase membrane anchor subunit
MAVYTVICWSCCWGQERLTYESGSAFMADGFMRFLTFLFVLSLMFHAWVGVRDIWMDYVKPTGVRLTLHTSLRSSPSSATPAGQSQFSGGCK